LQAHADQLYRVWDGTGDGHWDVVLTETTEGSARLLATMSFDGWSGLSATQEAISIAGTEAEAEMALPAEDVERLLPPVGRIRMLTDRGTEYCGNPEHHEYELYLALEDVDPTRTKTKSPQTNGIVERFHKTALDEFYRVAFRKKVYGSIAELQADLDRWVQTYNEERPHQGRWCFGKTPMQTFLDAKPLAREKSIAA